MRFLFLLLLPLTAYAQKTRNYAEVTADLCEKVSAAPSLTVRLAVVPFTATKSSEKASPAFGEYLTESVIGCLTGSEKIKLFERTRLDAILKEHEFILTDLMKPAAALKVGQLAPIDALLSGTFTVLKSYIDVSARMIDIGSGEITVSFNERIRITRNIATLLDGTAPSDESTTGVAAAPVTMSFNGSNSSPAVQTSKAEACRKKAEEFSSRLHDLSSNEKIEAVVAEAIKTPFDNECGQLHYHVMSSFARYKINHAGYKSFLLQTLDTISFPTGDERAAEIVRFVASDNEVDEKEWESGLAVASKVGNYSLSTYLGNLIGKPTRPDEETMKKRIQTFMNAAISGKVGLPRPLSPEVVFFEMMEGVKSNQPLRQYTYEEYAPKLTLDDRSASTMYSNLHGMYKDETNVDQKSMIIRWIGEFFNQHAYAKANEQLYDFAFEFELTANEQRNAEISKTHPQRDILILVGVCKDRFAHYATVSPYESQTDDRVDFCVRYDIPVPGVIPTMEEAAAILKGNDFDRQLRTVQMLSLMGQRPKAIESSLIDVLFRKSLENRDRLGEVQVQVIVILGNLPTASPKAIDYMISTLPHYGNDTEASEFALVRIGKPAVKQVVSKLERTTELEGGLQYQLITILGKIGKDAAEGKKAIQKVLNSSRNSDVKYAAEAALQAIGE
jgi:TolB-like protein